MQAGQRGHHLEEGDAPYQRQRTRNWLKIKCIRRQEFVIVGWTESDKRRGFRSLLLAAHEDGKLTYAGKVGTGFNSKLIEELMERMRAARDRQGAGRGAARRPRARTGSSPSWSPRSPLPNSPPTASCATRASSALREDKQAKEVVREMPEASDKADEASEDGEARRPPKASGSRSATPTG